jgi:hypothetical protein
MLGYKISVRFPRVQHIQNRNAPQGEGGLAAIQQIIHLSLPESIGIEDFQGGTVGVQSLPYVGYN